MKGEEVKQACTLGQSLSLSLSFWDLEYKLPLKLESLKTREVGFHTPRGAVTG